MTIELEPELRKLAHIPVTPPRPISDLKHGRRSATPWIISGVAVASACVAAGVVARSGGDPQSVNTASASPGPSPAAVTIPPFVGGPCDGPENADLLSPSEKAQLPEVMRLVDEERQRTGFKRVRAVTTEGQWICGWSEVTPSTDPQEALRIRLAMPMYDAPGGGDLIGYNVVAVGFVDTTTVESPGFDPAPLRIQVNGCDPVTDRTCEAKDPTVKQN